MKQHAGFSMEEWSDLYYFGRVLGRPILTSEVQWDTEGRQTHVKVWDFHGGFQSWVEYQYGEGDTIKQETHRSEDGGIIADGVYSHDVASRVLEIEWKAQGGDSIQSYSYDDAGRLHEIKRTNVDGVVKKVFAYSYDNEANMKFVREVPNEHGGLTEYRYDENENLVEETVYYHTVRLDKDFKILEGEDTDLASASLYVYNEHGDLVEIKQKGISGDQYAPFQEWFYQYDEHGLIEKRAGSYRGIPQVLVEYRYRSSGPRPGLLKKPVEAGPRLNEP